MNNKNGTNELEELKFIHERLQMKYSKLLNAHSAQADYISGLEVELDIAQSQIEKLREQTKAQD